MSQQVVWTLKLGDSFGLAYRMWCGVALVSCSPLIVWRSVRPCAQDLSSWSMARSSALVHHNISRTSQLIFKDIYIYIYIYIYYQFSILLRPIYFFLNLDLYHLHKFRVGKKVFSDVQY
ncbi:hypothetical protein AAG570_001267 [Ranatra chinensis]|uniref:Uncharacterized protein n=1 Tax=Ranatra chinensis TaxID=642074 RepID=A0ABD0YXT6_9HEMI